MSIEQLSDSDDQIGCDLDDVPESQATQQFTQLTQQYNFDDDDEDENDDNPDDAPPPRSPINLKLIPWGRLVGGGDGVDEGGGGGDTTPSGIGNINLLPRDPVQNIGSATRSRSFLSAAALAASSSSSQQQQQQQLSPENPSLSFMGITNLKPSDRFNEYVIGRSARCDVAAPTRDAATKEQSWVHTMISNAHCRIFCLLKHSPVVGISSRNSNTRSHTNSTRRLVLRQQEMEVYIEDSSGNGTLINNNTLLKRGERRILHTGDTISLLNPQIIRKKVRGVTEQNAILSHYSFIFINIHQTQAGGVGGFGDTTHEFSTPRSATTNNGDQQQQQSAGGESSNETGLKQIKKTLFQSEMMVASSLPHRSIFPASAAAANNNGKRGLVDVRATNSNSNDNLHNMPPPPEKRTRTSPRLQNKRKKMTDSNNNTNNNNDNINKNKHRKVEEIYDLRDEIGSGTCGQVRRAIHRHTGKEVAIKIIPIKSTISSIYNRGNNNNNTPATAATSSSPKQSELQTEASILKSLHHPYIVPLLDFFLHPQTAIYLVMELLPGGDLFDRIVEKGKYTEVESRRVMRRMLAAIHYLHQIRGIVHRDLKPENILCASRSDDVTVKLTDFGLAKSLEGGDGEGCKTFCGTPQYFAPEVLSRRYTVKGRGRYGKEADMWSLGVILYILLSGTPPFDVSDSMDVGKETKITFWDRGWKDISEGAKEFVGMLLETDPKERICVVDACSHKWILLDDGDTHCHPLDDPVLVGTVQDESRGGTEKENGRMSGKRKAATRSGDDGVSSSSIIVDGGNDQITSDNVSSSPAPQSTANNKNNNNSTNKNGTHSRPPLAGTTAFVNSNTSSTTAKTSGTPKVVTKSTREKLSHNPSASQVIDNGILTTKSLIDGPIVAGKRKKEPSDDEQQAGDTRTVPQRVSLFSKVKQLSNEGGMLETSISNTTTNAKTQSVASKDDGGDQIIKISSCPETNGIIVAKDDDRAPSTTTTTTTDQEDRIRDDSPSSMKSKDVSERPVHLEESLSLKQTVPISNTSSCTSVASSSSSKENKACDENTGTVTSVTNPQASSDTGTINSKEVKGCEEESIVCEEKVDESVEDNPAISLQHRGAKITKQTTLGSWFQRKN